ncbi:MAG TPA: hypothetical protein VIL29_13245 [Pseudothermotoga sp.]|uniref:hypothetical protein n=1 Tax=Thermotoga profunda TaxID=1508420 RepID=UPI0005971636|nr:hypothetical protein [Thermotoga profunda]
MKRLILLILIVLTVILLSGCTNLFFRIDAVVRITKVELTIIGSLKVDYTLTNVGNTEIDYYEIDFKGKCSDNTTISDWTNGLNVGPGETRVDYTFVSIGDKEVQQLYISAITLKNYNFGTKYITGIISPVPVPYNP